jgi:SAM-dependent methyltransferase
MTATNQPTPSSKATAADLVRELADKVFEYYRAYYRDDLGLPDWEQRIESFRRNEEALTGVRLEYLAHYTDVSLDARCALVVGCGTGAEMFYLAGKPGIEVHGIEPFDSAIDICRLKAKLLDLPPERVHKQAAERMNFPDGHFDLVVCFTVLEHVADVDAALREMARVLAPGGKALIVLPVYAYPEEPHYKVLALPPAFFPGVVKAQLERAGRPTAFFDSLNLLTRRSLGRRLRLLGIPHHFVRERSYRANPLLPIKLYSLLCGVDRNQFLVLTK